MSYWLFPYIVLLQCTNIFKIFARLFLWFMLREKGQQHNLSFDKQSTQSTNEKWWESDHHLGSYKLWQKPQLFLLQAAYWKQQTSQSSLRLNNLRMVLKYLPNGIPVLIKRLSKNFGNYHFLLLHRHWRKCDQHNYCHHQWNMYRWKIQPVLITGEIKKTSKLMYT